MVLAKEGHLELHHDVKPKLHFTTDVFSDDTDYKPTVINTPYLIPKERGDELNPYQQTFDKLTKSVMDNSSEKCLVVRSRYGSGKTTYLQRLIQEHDPKTVLFITYRRQTLARYVMRNFSKLGFQSYLDSYDDPSVWNHPRLIVQWDSLWNVLAKNDHYIATVRFDLKYDMIVLDDC